MSKYVFSLAAVFALVASLGAIPVDTFAMAPTSQAVADSSIIFIENAGQFPDGARFLVLGGDNPMWIGEDAIWLTQSAAIPEENGSKSNSLAGSRSGVQFREPRSLGSTNIKLTFPGSNPRFVIEPFERLETHVSYFYGNDPAAWKPDVPVWGGVRIRDLYPGIDLEIAGEKDFVAQRLIAHPGGDPGAVRFRIEGVEAVNLVSETLRLTTATGEVSLPLLAVADAQLVGKSSQRLVGAQAFEVNSPFTAGATYGLVEPTAARSSSQLRYGTFLGGSGGDDEGWAIAVDSQGAAYVTGYIQSYNFPITQGSRSDGRLLRCFRQQAGTVRIEIGIFNFSQR
jgi:hypothetical protein